MNRSPAQHSSSSPPEPAAVNQNEISTQILTPRTTGRPKRAGGTDQPAFNPDWHDAEEIIVPFDDSKYEVKLVSQKEWAEAYSPSRPPPQIECLRLETHRTVGKLVRSPGLWDDLAGFLSGLLFFAEILLLVWTLALLHSGFPISRGLAWFLVGSWVLGLVALRFVLARPKSSRAMLWLGSCVTTGSWLVWSPWSQEVITKLSDYFFLT
jgi:hypothetical protein